MSETHHKPPRYRCLYDTWEEFGTHPALEVRIHTVTAEERNKLLMDSLMPFQVSLNCVFALELTTDAIISAELIYYLSVSRTRFAK